MKANYKPLTSEIVEKIINPNVISVATAINSIDGIILQITYHVDTRDYHIHKNNQLISITENQKSTVVAWNRLLDDHDLLDKTITTLKIETP